MNEERLQKIADVLRSPPRAYPKSVKGFNMEWFEATDRVGWRGKTKQQHCGTVGCIAGFAAALFAPQGNYFMARQTADLLGLDGETAKALFYPEVLGETWHHVTPAQAAETIEKLIATGKVDWSHVEAKP